MKVELDGTKVLYIVLTKTRGKESDRGECGGCQ